MPQSGVCRVKGCTQHGLYFKRLDRHLKRVHPCITMAQHEKYQTPNAMERNCKKSSADRHLRRPCLVPDCRYYKIPVSRLSVHLRRRHQLTIKEHESLYGRGSSTNENCDNSINSTLFRYVVYTLPGACHFWEDENSS
jgi:hypothetical protein